MALSPESPGISRRNTHKKKLDRSGSFESLESDSSISNKFQSNWQEWRGRIPILKRVQGMFLRAPPRVRVAFVFFWFCWKIVLALFFLVLFLARSENPATSLGALATNHRNPTRILYIITTLAEYNTGARNTKKHQDRLNEVMLPILVDNVESMVGAPFHYQVDIFLIAGYELKPEREKLIQDRLPDGVGFQVWDDAAPVGYDSRYSPDKMVPNTRALARQHRYVIKDNFFDYDFFVSFEDDMRITGHHVKHFLAMSAEIDKLREMAPTALDDTPVSLHNKFFGQMTQQQLARVIPGFIRVEVLLDESATGTQKEVLPIAQDYDFGEHGIHHVDPQICCHVNMNPNIETPKTPNAKDIIIWETNIKAFSLRKLPAGSSMLDWIVLMLGPGKNLDPAERIEGFWSGSEGAFGDELRPSGAQPHLLAQQGGWMATREQIARMNSGLCYGSFLPPFDEPFFSDDGQRSMNVEYWSGSFQLFTGGIRGHCNMQRIISMHPDHFSKHLIYHVANNKQRQFSNQKNRLVRADHFLAQLNTVQKMASKAMDASK